MEQHVFPCTEWPNQPPHNLNNLSLWPWLKHFCVAFPDLGWRVWLIRFNDDFGCRPVHWTHINVLSEYICVRVLFNFRYRRPTRSFSGKNSKLRNRRNHWCADGFKPQSETPAFLRNPFPLPPWRVEQGEGWKSERRRWGNEEWDKRLIFRVMIFIDVTQKRQE